jgi:acarbose 7IV-phosphotransferase
MSLKKVFVIGGTTFDHIVYLPELPGKVPQTIHVAPFQETLGSTGSGKVLNLQKLEVPNILYSVMGDDIYGHQILDILKKNKIDFIFDIDPDGTERHFNIMDAEGRRISMFITQSSDKVDYCMTKIEKALVESDIIVLNIIGYCRNIIPLLRKFDKPVWTDLHDYDGKNPYHDDFIRASQYIFLSSDNLPDYRPVMERFIKLGKELVICTHGKLGASLLLKDGQRFEQPALLSYPMVDANGAGDSFFSGFLYGWINHKPYQVCMQMGAVCAGLCIGSKQLANESLSLSLLESEMKRHGFLV